tara:strand:+ start:807 stop:1211 length:405 start_codon:yes stop_codon:yes gene_type:complete
MSEELANLRCRVEYLERQLLDLKDKYIKLLEGKLAIGSQKSEVPKESSVTDLQILFLLKESRATNKRYAVTASQLHRAYNLNRSVKTIRNKLNDLELRGVVGSFGLKPISFFITPNGLAALDRSKRSSIGIAMR